MECWLRMETLTVANLYWIWTFAMMFAILLQSNTHHTLSYNSWQEQTARFIAKRVRGHYLSQFSKWHLETRPSWQRLIEISCYCTWTSFQKGSSCNHVWQTQNSCDSRGSRSCCPQHCKNPNAPTFEKTGQLCEKCFCTPCIIPLLGLSWDHFGLALYAAEMWRPAAK